MDRLRAVYHDASRRLGGSDSAPAATENALPRNTAQPMRQPPAEPLLSSRPPPSQAEAYSGSSGSTLAREDRRYLPSIRLSRRRHDASKPPANGGTAHDFAAGPTEADRSANTGQENLWTRARQRLGFGHAERDTQQPESNYDADMIDTLDAIGRCPVSTAPLKLFMLTSIIRSRSSNLDISDQCSKLTFRSQPRQIREQKTNILTYELVARC